MDFNKKLDLDLRDIYQMLISECRYGYTRNNHLMPGGAYDKVKRIVPQMYEVDKEYAINTIKQICEECISDQLMMNFYDGEDDEHGNRQEAINFVNWCLDFIHTKYINWEPYNYNLFHDNVERDNEPRYLVYELRGKSKRKKLITPEPVSEKEYINIIFDNIKEGTYRRETHKVTEKYGDRRRNYTYHIIAPIEKDFYVKHI